MHTTVLLCFINHLIHFCYKFKIEAKCQQQNNETYCRLNYEAAHCYLNGCVQIQAVTKTCFNTDVGSTKEVCSYQDIVDHLNLTTDNNKFKLTRPVLDHTHPTVVQLDIILYAILAVVGVIIVLSYEPSSKCCHLCDACAHF